MEITLNRILSRDEWLFILQCYMELKITCTESIAIKNARIQIASKPHTSEMSHSKIAPPPTKEINLRRQTPITLYFVHFWHTKRPIFFLRGR